MKVFIPSFQGLMIWLVLTSVLEANMHRAQPLQILYVTDYSDFWHDYHEQAKFLQETLPQYANLEVTVVGRTASDAKTILRQANFAQGYDAIFYNACHADTEELDLSLELLRQVNSGGIPILFLHCAMHNFRKTTSHPGFLEKFAAQRLKKQWQKEYPDLDFPVWWQLTGMDTSSHALPQKLNLKKEDNAHPITIRLPDEWQTSRDELYLSHEELPDIDVLYRSTKSHRGQRQAVAWVRETQGNRIFATSLGHDMQTLQQIPFQQLLANGLLWITGRLTDQGWPAPGYEGLQTYVNYSGSVRCQTGEVLTTQTIAEVQEAVRYALQTGQKLRAVSLENSNSYSPVICPEHGGILLQLKDMNQVLKIDRQLKQVRVQPGVRIADLNEILHAEGLYLPAMPDYNGVSIAGAMGTGSHHSSLNIPVAVSDWVASITLVDGLGQLRVLKANELRAGRVHLGILGVIVEVTLNLVESTKLRYQYESISDEGNFAKSLLTSIKSHDYARASWFPHSSKIIVESYDRQAAEVEGESVHNLWQANAGLLRAVGELPSQILNLGQGVQCKAESLRAKLWQVPFQVVNSPADSPVGWAHQMLASDCEKGSCAWDLGLVNRTMEVAFPVEKFPQWVDEVKEVLAARKACFPILGIYLRFAKAGSHFLGLNADHDIVLFEIHIPTRPKSDGFEPSAEVYDEIVQLTLSQYRGRPHWGKNSRPYFLQLGVEQYRHWNDFVKVKQSLDPTGLFESEFWRDVFQQNIDNQKTYLACAYDGACICSWDLDCGSERSCRPGGYFSEARVCVAKP
ncbi:MAG: D-arabinono-1,4-lactone oxidase [Oligoflexus sp.]